VIGHAVAVPDAEALGRWRDWHARGVKADQRRAIGMGRLAVLIAVALSVSLLVQLV
jgi:hypothetical protein